MTKRIGRVTKRVAVVFCGYQDLFNGQTVRLWTLLEDIPGHPQGSTVSETTLKDQGYDLEPT